MPRGKNPGPSILKPDTYEALKDKGMSKSKAAAISNAQHDKLTHTKAKSGKDKGHVPQMKHHKGK